MGNLSPKRVVHSMDEARGEADKPHVGTLEVDGCQPYQIAFYTPRQWRALPQSQRPLDAYQLSGGAWYTFRPGFAGRDSG